MNKHEEHQKKGIVYQATCEECQKEQLGKFSETQIHAVSYFAFVRGTAENGMPIETKARKQPRRKNCE